MGIVQHTAILVTGFDTKFKKDNYLFKARTKALKIFGKDLVTDLKGTGMNGYYTFVVVPCGSNLGYEMSDDFLSKIANFIDYLDGLVDKDGCSVLDYVKLSYGELNSEMIYNRDFVK